MVETCFKEKKELFSNAVQERQMRMDKLNSVAAAKNDLEERYKQLLHTLNRNIDRRASGEPDAMLALPAPAHAPAPAPAPAGLE